LRRATLLVAGRHDADSRESLQRSGERSKTLGSNPIIVGQQNVRHGSDIFLQNLKTSLREF
jgi:hypothetical protein